jgi:hypothetical protein
MIHVERQQPMRLATRTNIEDVFKDLDGFVRDAKSLAAARTLNVLGGQASVVGFRKIAERYGVSPRITEKYASVELASPSSLEATITVKGAGYPLSAFQPIPTKRGVSVKLKGKRVLFQGTFMARMPNGHVGVFARGAYAGKGATTLRVTGRIGRFVLGRGRRVKRANQWGSSELPINELYTFSPSDTFANDEVVEAMQDRVEAQAPIVMQRELAAIKRGF